MNLSAHSTAWFRRQCWVTTGWLFAGAIPSALLDDMASVTELSWFDPVAAGGGHA